MSSPSLFSPQPYRPPVGNPQYNHPFEFDFVKTRIPKYHYSFLRSLEICLSHFRWDICTNPGEEDLREHASRECTLYSPLEELITWKLLGPPPLPPSFPPSSLSASPPLSLCWCGDKDKPLKWLCGETSTKSGDHKPDLSHWSLWVVTLHTASSAAHLSAYV